MKIINLTKGTVLADSATLADTPLSRIKGLLGKREFLRGQAMILRPCNSIHTFFMTFAIDVLFVNKSHQIVKTLSDLSPFKLSNICFKSSYAVELPAGIITATNSSVGDILQIVE